MGFDSSITKFPKYKDVTLLDIYAVDDYYSYSRNEWAKSHFATAEEYCKYLHDTEVDKDVLEFYRQFSDNKIVTTVAWWCSNGIQLHELITKLYDNKNLSDDSVVVELTKDNIYELIQKLLEEFNKWKLSEAYITHSFRQSDEDNDDIIVSKCDGVEVSFGDDGSIQRLYTNDEYDSPLLIFKEVSGLESAFDIFTIVNTLQEFIKVFNDTDFEKESVYYSGGW